MGASLDHEMACPPSPPETGTCRQAMTLLYDPAQRECGPHRYGAPHFERLNFNLPSSLCPQLRGRCQGYPKESKQGGQVRPAPRLCPEQTGLLTPVILMLTEGAHGLT